MFGLLPASGGTKIREGFLLERGIGTLGGGVSGGGVVGGAHAEGVFLAGIKGGGKKDRSARLGWSVRRTGRSENKRGEIQWGMRWGGGLRGVRISLDGSPPRFVWTFDKRVRGQDEEHMPRMSASDRGGRRVK